MWQWNAHAPGLSQAMTTGASESVSGMQLIVAASTWASQGRLGPLDRAICHDAHETRDERDASGW